MRILHIFKKLFLALCLVVLFTPLVVTAQGTFKGDGNVKIPSFFNNTDTLAGADSFGGLVLNIIDIILIVVGSISVLFFIIGGFRYVVAHGNEEQAEGAKKTMTHAIVGLIVVIMSFAIIYIITNVLTTTSL